MTRRIRWRELPCEICGEYVTTNGLGRDAHMKACKAKAAMNANAKEKAEEKKGKANE
jgi:hypothetical protein